MLVLQLVRFHVVTIQEDLILFDRKLNSIEKGLFWVDNLLGLKCQEQILQLSMVIFKEVQEGRQIHARQCRQNFELVANRFV